MKRLFFAFAMFVLLAGCEKAKQDMYDQPKYKPMSASPLWEDGTSARPLPEGTVPHAMGPFSGTSSGRVGEGAVENEEIATHAQTNPYPVTMQLLKRGQDRYTIYCLPCHSPLGDGDGWITRRGFPHPPSYHSDRLRNIPDRHIFDVITNGYGIMYPYADRVAAPDRWAIVAYIRALQLSQYAQVANLTPEMRAELEQTSEKSQGAEQNREGATAPVPYPYPEGEVRSESPHHFHGRATP